FGTTEPGASTRSVYPASFVFIAVALVGFLVSLLVRDTGVRSEGRNLSPWFWVDVSRNLKAARSNRYLFLSLFAVAFFLFVGAGVQLTIISYGHLMLGLSKASSIYLFLAPAFGMGLGSYLAGVISRRNVEIGLVPVGAVMIALGLLAFAMPFHETPFGLYATIGLMVLLGIGGGFYIVPLNTYIQQAAPKEIRGELIATGNVLSFCGVLLVFGLLLLMDMIGLNPAHRFVVLGVLTLGLTIYVVWILPDFLIRFVGLLVARIIYRLDSVGLENLPIEGPALLVGNHVSYADAVLLGATHQRRIRFLMYRDIYNHPLFGWLFRLMKTIPISLDDPPKEIVRSLRAARQALDEGYLVCMFGEGSMTRTGYINGFRRGMEYVARGSSYPIIPVCLHGVWGSLLSYSHGRILGRIPRPLRRRVTVLFGKPLSPETHAFDARQAVMELQSEAYERDRVFHQSLPIEFARVARSRWRRFCMADTTGRKLSFGETLTSSLALAQVLKERVKDDENVGLLLPASVGGALANVAVSFLGKVPVNLNYTTSADSLLSAVEQCGIRHVITSQEFLDRVSMPKLPGVLCLEDLRGEVTTARKIRAFAKALFKPRRWLVADPSRRDGVDHTAVIIFSSGSTGVPKGVVLSHYNIIANAQSIQAVFRLAPDEMVCGVLPFFHSFGFTIAIWLPLLAGVRVAYHSNPLEAEKVGRLVKKHECTLLACTPTFLQSYTRRVSTDEFSPLRIVITGAEKLNPRTADAFEEKFGIRPMEGYGTTELSPVASVNLPDVEVGGVSQAAHRPGSIGRPIPGVTMKVVDPENFERELGHGEEGMLLVKGPNVMQGYLNRPDLTAEVLRGDWYVTGDMAYIEQDGFVTITDRLSRFTKIGGEMVPHQAIEEKLHEFLDTDDQVAVVTSVSDERKGERLVVLLTPKAGDPQAAWAALRDSGLPNLWVPAKRDFFSVDELPVLGTGKLDLKGVKDLALEMIERAGTGETARNVE
ncbi:MFS transporter, partial [bacterium]|nr:MFS transporter [bacterium]